MIVLFLHPCIDLTYELEKHLFKIRKNSPNAESLGWDGSVGWVKTLWKISRDTFPLKTSFYIKTTFCISWSPGTSSRIPRTASSPSTTTWPSSISQRRWNFCFAKKKIIKGILSLDSRGPVWPLFYCTSHVEAESSDTCSSKPQSSLF